MDIVWNHPNVFNKAGLFSGAFWWRTRDKDDPAYRDEKDRIMHWQVREGSYGPGLNFFFECGTEDEKEDRNQNGKIDSIDDTLDLIAELVAKGYDPQKDIGYLEIAGGRHDMATWAWPCRNSCNGDGAPRPPGKVPRPNKKPPRRISDGLFCGSGHTGLGIRGLRTYGLLHEYRFILDPRVGGSQFCRPLHCLRSDCIKN